VLVTLDQPAEPDQLSGAGVVALDAVEIIFDALVNVDQRIPNLAAPLDDLPAQGEEVNFLMHLEKSVMAKQVV
jgi:hypothetical protein